MSKSIGKSALIYGSPVAGLFLGAAIGNLTEKNAGILGKIKNVITAPAKDLKHRYKVYKVHKATDEGIREIFPSIPPSLTLPESKKKLKKALAKAGLIYGGGAAGLGVGAYGLKKALTKKDAEE